MSITELFSHECATCRQPGPALCRPCRFALAASATVEAGGVGAALRFEGTARQAVLALKYRNRKVLARHLAMLMVRRLHLDRSEFRADLVTWAPTGAAHLRARGFDQAELLAREVAKLLGVPCRRLLYRSHGPAQTGRSRAERMSAAGPGFRARAARPGLSVLVVDDVVTTGATLHAAADALYAAGVGTVRLVAAAATPPSPAGASTAPTVRLARAS